MGNDYLSELTLAYPKTTEMLGNSACAILSGLLATRYVNDLTPLQSGLRSLVAGGAYTSLKVFSPELSHPALKTSLVVTGFLFFAGTAEFTESALLGRSSFINFAKLYLFNAAGFLIKEALPLVATHIHTHLFSTAPSTGTVGPADVSPANLKKIKTAIAKLEKDLASVQTKDESYAQSGLSLLLLLGMLIRGMPKDNVASFLKKLGLDGMSEKELHQGLQQLQHEIGHIQEPKMTIANAVAANLSKVASDFSDDVCTHYGAETLPPNLTTINNWVSKKTDALIPKLLQSLDPSASVLINTVLFKGKWNTPFDTSEMGVFTTLKGEKINAKIMTQKGAFEYYKGDDFSMLSKEHKAEAGETPFKYTIFLPDDPTDVQKLEGKLSDEFVARCHAQAAMTSNIQLSMPETDLKTENRALIASLKKLGYPIPATMARFDGQELSEMGQVCCIKSDKEGTEAAAASYAMTRESCSPSSLIFDATRPFIAQISRGDHSIFQLAIKNEKGLVTK